MVDRRMRGALPPNTKLMTERRRPPVASLAVSLNATLGTRAKNDTPPPGGHPSRPPPGRGVPRTYGYCGSRHHSVSVHFN